MMSSRSAARYLHYADETLLRMVSRKDIQAYEMLYDRHAQTVYNLLARMVHEAPVAEELLLEVFWHVWQKPEQYESPGSVAAWLYQMARAKALDYLRRPQAQRQRADATRAPLAPASHHQARSAESEVEQSWRRQQVQQALESIPGEQRLYLELAYFEGVSQREIAERTDTPLATVKAQMHLGMEKLERLLRAVGYLVGENRQ